MGIKVNESFERKNNNTHTSTQHNCSNKGKKNADYSSPLRSGTFPLKLNDGVLTKGPVMCFRRARCRPEEDVHQVDQQTSPQGKTLLGLSNRCTYLGSKASTFPSLGYRTSP